MPSFSRQELAQKKADKSIDSSMHEAVAAIAGCGVSPVVRIAANESWMVKRKLPTVGRCEEVNGT